jgi:hypothetical protein
MKYILVVICLFLISCDQDTLVNSVPADIKKEAAVSSDTLSAAHIITETMEPGYMFYYYQGKRNLIMQYDNTEGIGIFQFNFENVRDRIINTNAKLQVEGLKVNNKEVATQA